MLEREWVSGRDPDDDDHLRFTVDVSFPLSGYRCVYGAGCQGVRTDSATLEVHATAPVERGTWGVGGDDLHRWCTEEPGAHSASQPGYRSLEAELRAMVGDAVYAELARFLDRRARQRSRVRFLPVVGRTG